MPEEGKNKIEFKNYNKQQKSPFIIYADFEALIKKIEGAERDPNKSNTQNTQLHEACSYCYIVVRSDGKTKKPVEYRGPNAAEHMSKSLMKEQDEILQELANSKKIKMTEEDKINFKNAENCYNPTKRLPMIQILVNKLVNYMKIVLKKIIFIDFIGPRAKPEGNAEKYENCYFCKEKLTKKTYKIQFVIIVILQENIEEQFIISVTLRSKLVQKVHKFL